MLLLTGSPGSGKSHLIVESVRAELRRGASDFRLLVPTATMAEHLKNQLAREDLPLRPGVVTTLARFVAPWVREYPEIPPASLELLVDRVLATKAPEQFARVARLPGFRRSLSELIEEFSSAGCDCWRLAQLLEAGLPEAPLAGAFLAVYQNVEQETIRRGWAPRAIRLRGAAEEIRAFGLGPIHRIFLDGFFTLGAPELHLIDALCSQAAVTVALPSWEGSTEAREALRAMGFAERILKGPARRAPHRTLVTATNIDQEAEEIARRILEQAGKGRQFREMGIVLRSRTPYVPVLRTVLERFGIPARFYFSEPLANHATVRYLSGAVEAMLGGWDHADTLELLKMAPSGFATTPACDRFEFTVLSQLPGNGLKQLRELSDDPKLLALLDRLSALAPWAGMRQTPAQWAAACHALRGLVRTPAIEDGVSHDRAALWRSQAAALEAFGEAIEEAAGALVSDQPVPFSDFWRAVTLVAAGTPLRVADGRRNVVHVMDVYEARQWELPVVFVCGLLEKQFPLYPSPDPVFPEAARRALNHAGLSLATAARRQREEGFLFEMALTRATSELVLSYPEYNAKGEPNLPSFFLDELALAPVKARGGIPACARLPHNPPQRYIEDRDVLENLRAQHQVMRPSAIESFLQCPFQFFVAHTLELEEPPPRPGARLSAPLQGQIVHQTLSDLERTRKPLNAVFQRVFEEACQRERVLDGCRTELARLKMLRDLHRYRDRAVSFAGWRTSTEEQIRFPLGDGIEVSGRIDRFEVSEDDQAVVFDFKYSGAQGIRNRIRGYEEGRHVQGGLYLLGLNRVHGYTPAGMFYCGLRGEVNLDGWHIGLPGLERVGTACTPQVMWEQLEAARSTALRAADEILRGKVEAAPEDSDRCQYCAFMDVCRAFEKTAPAAAEGAAQ
jgi:ATP-dependent helicase/DNAse subunit B